MPMTDAQIRDLETQAQTTANGGAHDQAAGQFSQAGDEWAQRGASGAGDAGNDYTQSASEHEQASTQARTAGDAAKAAAEDSAAMDAHAKAADQYALAAQYYHSQHLVPPVDEARALDAEGAQLAAVASALEASAAQQMTDAQQDADMGDAYERSSERRKDDPALAAQDDKMAADYYQSAHDKHRSAEHAYKRACGLRQKAANCFDGAVNLYDAIAAGAATPGQRQAAEDASTKADDQSGIQSGAVRVDREQETKAREAANKEQRKATREGRE